jgi:hypothetical protein
MKREIRLLERARRRSVIVAMTAEAFDGACKRCTVARQDRAALQNLVQKGPKGPPAKNTPATLRYTQGEHGP